MTFAALRLRFRLVQDLLQMLSQFVSYILGLGIADHTLH